MPFQFQPSSEAQAEAFYADPTRAEAYAKAKQQYERQLEQWKSTGGENLAWREDADKLRHWNFLNLRHGMGDGGFQGEGEGYTLECHHVLHDYALCFESVFGRPVTGFNDIGFFAPATSKRGSGPPKAVAVKAAATAAKAAARRSASAKASAATAAAPSRPATSPAPSHCALRGGGPPCCGTG